jgi:AcrR family transcriptional regulator
VTNTRRDEVLDVACAMIAERGYRGTSLDAIARQAGLTRQGVLHYFPSKHNLLTAILDRETELARGDLPAGQPDEDLPDRLADVVARNRAHPGPALAYSVLIGESVAATHPAHQHFHDHYRQVRARIAAGLTERWGERLPSGLRPDAAAVALLALLDGMQQQWLLDPGQSDHPEIMRDVVTILLGRA